MVVSVFAHGDSAAFAEPETPHEFQQTNNAVMANRPAIPPDQVVAFSSTLRETPRHGGILIAGLNHSRPGDVPREQGPDDPVTLPEPRTGVLLSIGLFAIIQMRGRMGALVRKTRDFT